MPYSAEFLLVGRVLFGILFLYNGINHFVDYEGRTGYAEYKDVPASSALVLSSGVVLVLGALGIILGVYPVVSAGALAVFLIVTTVLIHDFWDVPDEERENELNHFLKNVGLLGATLVFVSIGGETWTYALNITFF